MPKDTNAHKSERLALAPAPVWQDDELAGNEVNQPA
jgi:hypothetical protein